MARALELVIGGLSLGGIYALLAFAMSLTISTTRVLNVAHGVFFVWGGATFRIRVVLMVSENANASSA